MQNNTIYTFSERFPYEFPSQIVVDVTEQCNLACAHCFHKEFAESSQYSGRHMSDAVHDKLIDEAATDGKGFLRYLRYTAMGEPLLHPHIFLYLDKAKRCSGTAVTLTTNGTLLTEEAAIRILDAGVDIVDISIDAFSPEVYTAVRRGGNREKTYANVIGFLALRDQRRGKTKIVTSFIEQPFNRSEADTFRRFWLEHGADEVVIRRLHSQAGRKQDIAARFLDAQKSLLRRPCLYPWERLSIGATGKISFCPASWLGLTEFADFATLRIKEVWQGAFMQQLRQQHLSNCFKTDNPCLKCPDWAQTRWPHEGRSYADMVEEMVNHDELQMSHRDY